MTQAVSWTEPVVLEGRHARLEPLGEVHLAGLCEVGLDPALWELTVSRVRDEADMRAYVEHALAEHAAGRALPFAIVERASGRAIGSTRYGNVDPPNRKLEIGWTWLGRAWQRTPVNTECKLLLMRRAFEELGCVRVEFKTDVLNVRSRRALARIGAREEGVLRAHQITESGRVRDTVYFSVVAGEWPRVRGRLERLLAAGVRAGGSAGPSPSDRALQIDDDRSRIDVDALHRMLSSGAYWAQGRPRTTVERLLREASRVVGLYADGRLVGFARAVSDHTAFAYLADVYVEPEFRGRGWGAELVREIVDRSPFSDRRWLLHTDDAHDLYRKLGFGRPSERVMERPARVEAGGGDAAR